MTREGEGRLVLALGLVAGTCVYAFSRVFSGRAWLIPALVAAWGAIALSRWLAHLRTPKVVATAVLVVAGTFFVLLVVFPQSTFYGLPGPGSIHKAVSTVKAANASISDVTAPIAPDPGYLALAMAAAWFAGSLSGALIGSPHRGERKAGVPLGQRGEGQRGEGQRGKGQRGENGAGLRSLSPSLLAPVPWVLLFTVAAGVGQGRGRLFDAALFFAAVLAYLLAEGWSSLGKLPKLDGAIRLGALSMAGAVLLPNLVPGYRAGPVFPWARIGPLTETTVSPLVEIKPRLLNQSNVPLFKVTADQPAYWRLTSLDHFDGNAWSSQGTYNPASGVLATPSPAIASQVVHQHYDISGLGGIWVPAAYQVTRVSGLKSSVDPTSQTLIVGALHPGTTYDIVSAAPEPTGLQLSAAGVGSSGPSPDDLQLPGPTIALIGPITRSLVGSNANPYDQAVAIQRYLRSFNYDEHVDALSSTNYLYDFLTRTKSGFCQQFAGAMAVMLRTLGIPSRVAVGFLPGQPTVTPSGTTYQVTGHNAHAWPEAYFQGIGWVAFEPTPRADALPPNYTVAPAPVTTTQVAPASPEASAAPSATPGGPQPDATHSAAPRKASHPAMTAARRASNDLLIALAAALVLLFVARELRLRLPGWAARSAPEKAVAAYDEFILRAADALGEGRLSGETEAEYARSVTQSLSLPPAGAADVMALTHTYQKAAYSLQAPGPAEITAALGANRALRTRLRKGADWRGKARLAFSPRPLYTRPSARTAGTRKDAYDRPRSRRAPSAARKV